jgi:hypothetical protein
MTAILLTSLFAASGVLACTSIRQSWRRYGRSALALRGQLRDCSEWRDVTVTIYETKVHPAGAVILRPAFKAPERAPVPAHALPAAA